MKRTLRNITMFLAAASVCAACEPCEDTVAELLPTSQQQETSKVADSLALLPEWAEIKEGEGFVLAMSYAGTANFTHRKIYGCARCLLRPEVAAALRTVQKKAAAQNLKIVIFDAYRPLPYQQKMYDIMSDKRYVADPAKGSMHNRGAAVDISLADSGGKLLDMGTAFDDFSAKAAYAYKELTNEQKQNRELLRKLMLQAGFEPYDAEWWHFNFRKQEYALSDYIWPCR